MYVLGGCWLIWGVVKVTNIVGWYVCTGWLLVDMRSGREGWSTSKESPVNTKECSWSGESADTYFVLQDFYLCVRCFFSTPRLVGESRSQQGGIVECVGGVHCLETGAVHIRQFPLWTALTLLPLDNHDDDTHADDDGKVVVLSKDEDNFYFDEGEVHYHVHLLAHVLL